MAALFDAYERPVQLERLKEGQAGPTLGGVRNIYSTLHPERSLTPERLTAILQTAEMGDPWMYLELAESMEEKDLHYLSVLSTRKHAVAGLEISVQPASQAKEDLMAADLVRDQLLNGELDMCDAATDQLDAIGKGFSVLEIDWDGVDEWYPRALVWRDPRWFVFDWISGEQILVRSLKTEGATVPGGAGSGTMNFLVRPTGTGQEIGIQPGSMPLSPFRFITHVAKAKSGLPIRGGLARAAGYNYLFKNYVLKDWVVFAEVFGQGLRIGKYGPGASAQDKQQLLNAVMNIGTDCSAIIPESMMIEFVKNDMRASIDLYERFLEYADKQVSKAVLWQTMTSDVPKSGGLGGAGVAKVHDLVRHDIAEDDAKKLAASWRRDLVKPIVDINLGPRKVYPKILIGFPQEQNLEALEALGPLIDHGFKVPTKGLYARLGVTPPAEGEEVLHPLEKISDRENPQGRGGDNGADPDTASPVATGRFAREHDDRSNRDAIERFVEQLRDESDDAMRPIIEPLLEEMALATNYEDLKTRSVGAVKRMFLGRFQEMLARAGFKVNLAGNLGLRVTDPTARAAQIARKQTPRS
jgi:phage gp29-like protein